MEDVANARLVLDAGAKTGRSLCCVSADQVLVIDDDDDIRQTVADALEFEHLVVHSARNGQEGLELLRAGLRPCLILLDMRMPVMDGWKFVHAVAADPALSSIRVCVFSATGLSAEQKVPPNVVAVLRKPVRLETLLDVLRNNGCRAANR